MADNFTLPTLLVISDNPSVRYWLKKQLDSQFFLIESTTKARALETALNATLHCIILDSAFKPCDVLELATELRKTPSNLLTPILLITDQLKKSYRTKATGAGVTDFLFEPLDAEELAAKIENIQKTNDSRHKVLGLSSRIGAPIQAASSSFFKNKIVLHDQPLQVLADAKNQGVPVKMLAIQIDRYKEIAARLDAGALADVVRNFTALVEESVGKKGTLCHSKDGQFILLIPDTNPPASQAIAENLRKLIQKQRFSTPKGILHLTASIAISDVDTSETSFNRMIDATKKSFEQSTSLHNQIFFIDKKDS